MPSFRFDETDLNIVAQLRRDGRRNNKQIAQHLGLTAATVSMRIRRMEDANQLRVVAVTDFAACGANLLLRVAVEVRGRPASAVAADLARLPNVFAVHLMTGRYDVDMLVGLNGHDELAEIALDEFSRIEGVRSLTPSIVSDIIKYEFDVAPIRGEVQPLGPTCLDLLDQGLVATLARDARVSNRKIARQLGVTEGTVRGRIRRLKAERLIAFTAITGFELSKKSRLGFILVEACPSHLAGTAQAVADLPAVNAVLVTLGAANLIAMTLFDEIESFIELASDAILPMPGVQHVETAIAVKTIRYDPQVVKITSRAHTRADR